MRWKARVKTSLFTAAVVIAGTTAMVASPPVLAQLSLVNKGGINPHSWKYGPRNDDTTGGAIWNPAKLKILAGDAVL